MRRIIIRIQEFFASEKKPEVAAVPYERLQYWTDLQYKPLLKNTFEALRKHLMVCKDAATTLTQLQKELEEYQPINQRVDVQTKVLNKKQSLVKALNKLQNKLGEVEKLEELFEMYAFYQSLEEEITSLLTVRQEVGEILQEHMGKLYVQIVQLSHTLDQNCKQARSLFADSVNRNYLQAQKSAKSINTKREKSSFYTKKMEITKNEVLERRNQVQELRSKISRIKNDPKYALEKQSIHSGAGKYSLSFYDLEIDKFEKQISEIAQEIVSLKDHYHKLNDEKNALNVEGSIQTFKDRMLNDFSIEVELVSEQTE